MAVDVFAQRMAFYGVAPRRVIIVNTQSMLSYVSRSKNRSFHPRFLALITQYVMERVACTPASGWKKGQIENQVQFCMVGCSRAHPA